MLVRERNLVKVKDRVRILSFSELVNNLRFVEKTKVDKHVQILLGLTWEEWRRYKRSERVHESLNSQILYARFMKYCNLRDIDANDFFTRKLGVKEEEAEAVHG
jgi:hypothetical protein